MKRAKRSILAKRETMSFFPGVLLLEVIILVSIMVFAIVLFQKSLHTDHVYKIVTEKEEKTKEIIFLFQLEFSISVKNDTEKKHSSARKWETCSANDKAAIIRRDITRKMWSLQGYQHQKIFPRKKMRYTRE